MGFRQFLLSFGLVLTAARLLVADPSESLDPLELISAFPLGTQVGSVFELEVKGKGLAEVTAVWFECGDIRATIKCIEKLEPEDAANNASDSTYEAAPPDPATYRVLLEVTVDPGACLGLHGFRLVTARGMSNGLPLQVVSEPVIVADSADHQRPEQARRITPPVVVSGKIESKGQLDFYTFDVAAKDEYRFEAFSNFKPGLSYRAKVELALYDDRGSWFNSGRINRINSQGPALTWQPMYALTRWFDQRTFPTEFALFPYLNHRYSERGRALVSVGSFLGAGAPGAFYLLRIVPSGEPIAVRDSSLGRPAHSDPGDWLERDSSTLRQWGSFSREIAPTRLQTLAGRSVAEPVGAPSLAPASDILEQCEAEPNGDPGHAREVTIPGIATGRIGAPGDIDYFRFAATAGQKLAFEIETPCFSPPLFNPWLRVRDSAGRLLFSNIYKEYGGDGDDVNKNLERKTLYTFQDTGTYSLEIRDLSLRDGSEDACYRVLIRPQIPHVGRIELNLDVVSAGSVLVDRADHVNLEVGQSKEIVLVCEKEEGFDGSVIIAAGNLPPGVELFSSTPSDRTESVLTGFQYRPPNLQVMPPGNYRADRGPITLVLVARRDAVASTIPTMVRLTARPVVSGRAGVDLPVISFPLMVVAAQRGNREEKSDLP